MENIQKDHHIHSTNTVIETDISISRISSDSSLNLEDDSNTLNLGFADAQLSLDDNIPSSKIDPLQINDSNPRDVDEVVDVLKTDQIRWFYKNLTNKQWVEFNGYDSLRIEKRYQELSPEEWKYYNSVYRSHNTATKTQTANSTIDALRNGNSNPVDDSSEYIPEFISPNSETVNRVVVRGGLYEVDLLKRNCASIFWPGEDTVITRGTWFYESWQPLDEEVSEVLENMHLSYFLGKRHSEYDDGKTPKKVVLTKVLSDAIVEWYAPLEAYMYSQGTPSKIVRSFTQRLGGYFQKKSGSRLLRGYKDLATDTDRPKDITHLVFVVHGIGQKMDIGGRILQNTSVIRQNVTSLHNRLFPNSSERAEFFPVEWRTSLTLDGGLVEAITPLHLTQLRNILNTSAMDIMYYTSPIYCAEIQRGLITEINRLYSMFVERNPNHNTKVSVVAHSLGSVLVYDIITGWLPTDPTVETNGIDVPAVGKSSLNFHVDNLFLLGSPLAVFLALRFPRGQHGYHLFPPSLCNRVYNIFHISDPVAYRLEPLVRKEYSRIAPLKIWPCNSPHRIPYSDMPLELIDQDKDQSASNSATTSPTPKEESSVSPAETPVKEKGWSIWSLMRGAQNRSQDGTSSPHQMDSPTSRGLEHRLDYVIKVSGSLGVSARSYINMLSCHTAYWSNEDVGFFILTRLFPELDEAVDVASTITEDKTLVAES